MSYTFEGLDGVVERTDDELNKIKEHMRLDIMRETASGTPGGQQYKSRIKNLLSKYIVYIGNVQHNKRFDGGEY